MFTGAGRPRPSGGPRRPHSEDNHLNGDDDIEIVGLAVDLVHPHCVGHRRCPGAGRCDPGRYPRRAGQRGQICCSLRAVTCHHHRAEVCAGRRDAKQHRDHRACDYSPRPTIIAGTPTPTRLWP